jgi:hypothetical protein
VISPTLLTASSTVTRTVSAVATEIPVRRNVANPVRVNSIEYVPAVRYSAVNRPASLVTSSLRELVSWLVTMTVAPGTTALVGSVTAPVMVADRIWANAEDAQASVSRSTSEERQRFSATETFLPDYAGNAPSLPRRSSHAILGSEGGNRFHTSGRILSAVRGAVKK